MANIFQSDKSAISVAFQDDVIELARFRETTDNAHADLEILTGHRRLGTDLSGGHFNILLLKSANHITSSKRSTGHTHRIEPEAHREFSFAKDEDIRNARNALQIVANVN